MKEKIRTLLSAIRLWMVSRSNSLLAALIILAILILINIISVFNFFRLDLTENGKYTLSKSSRKIVRQLDDIISIKVYFSRKLPPTMANHAQQVYDILKEYAVYGKGNIRLEFIDPSSDVHLKQEMRGLGIPEVQLDVIQKDKREIMPVYLGIALFYGDQREIHPVVKDTANLEYKITSSIKKLIEPRRPSLGILMNDSLHSIYAGYSMAARSMSEQYQLVEVDIPKTDNVITDTNIRTLLVVGPTNVKKNVKMALDHFVMRGGRIIFLIDQMRLANGLSMQQLNTGLDDLLDQYGFTVRRDLALDRSCQIIGFRSGNSSFMLPYPFAVKALNPNFDKNNPAVKDLDSVSFQWISTITNSPREGVEYSALIKTTRYAWRQEGYFNLNPQYVIPPQREKDYSQFNLLMMGKGSFASLFEPGKKSPETYVIVAGDSDFAGDAIAQNAPEGLLLLQNLVDWLTLSDDLISIRSRGISDRPIAQVSDGTKTMIRIVNIAGIALVIIVFGLIRLYFRRKEREDYLKNIKEEK
jgi:gliding-associated putative ABC transporter substrate-binding component GldG